MPNAPKCPVILNGRTYYHLRVDYRSQADYDTIIRYVKQTTATNILLVHEISKVVSKPHIHCIFDETRSLARLRAMFQERFLYPYDGKKKEYCFEHVEGDLEAAERYVCKGKDIRLKTGKYTDELVQVRNKQYWEINAECVKANTMKPTDGTLESFGFVPKTQVIIHEIQRTPRKSRSFIADVVQSLESSVSEMDDWEWFHPAAIRNHSEMVLRTLLKMHGRDFKPYGDSQIENEFNVIVQCLSPDYQTKTMLERLKHRGVIPL